MKTTWFVLPSLLVLTMIGAFAMSESQRFWQIP